MTVVFDAPIRSNLVHHSFWRQPFGQRDVMSEERTLLLSDAPLAFDAPKCGQPRKARRVRRRRDDAGAAALEPIVPFLLSFVKCELAGRIGQREGADRASKERTVVAFEFESVMGARRADLRGHFGMAVQSVGGDPTALQIQAFQRLQRRGDLVAVRTRARGDRYAGLRVPDAHHQRRHARAPALIAAPQAFAVESDHALDRSQAEAFAQGLSKIPQTFLQFRRIEQTEQSRETVVARRAVWQIDDLGQFLDMSGGKISIAHATLCSAKRSDQRNEKHRRAIMPRVEVSGIANLAQNSNQDFHQWPSESGSRPKNPFLRSTQYPYIHPNWGLGPPGRLGGLFSFLRDKNGGRIVGRPPSCVGQQWG